MACDVSPVAMFRSIEELPVRGVPQTINVFFAVGQNLKQTFKDNQNVRVRFWGWGLTICITFVTRISSKNLLENSLMFEKVVFLGFLPSQSSIAGKDGINLNLCHYLKTEIYSPA